jgi:DNA/RNA endonuclease YhcR with UshA esterase domain
MGCLMQFAIAPSNVKYKGLGRPVAPAAVDTGSVNEATEGRLVVVEGVISQAVSNDLPFGYMFSVDDGSGEIQIFVSASTEIDLSGLALGQPVRVIGFSGQFATTYEVQPRVQSDLRVLP